MKLMSLLDFSTEVMLLCAALGFIVCLKLLSSPRTARIGNIVGALCMVLAVAVTFFQTNPPNYVTLLLVIAAASVCGVIAGRTVKMTSMPEMVAIFNGFGGIASVCVTSSEMIRYFLNTAEQPESGFILAAWFSAVVGAITFSGSMIAFGKLRGFVPSRPVLYPGQRFLTIALLFLVIAMAVRLVMQPEDVLSFAVVVGISMVMGILLVISIGGADMPVVVSLLNSYSGVAALSAGFVVDNNQLLIVCGALVGASGIILTKIMCRAMNRSLWNVVFGVFGDVAINIEGHAEKPMREFLPIDAALLMRNANRVIIIPGYGLAVSQAQHNLRELADLLKSYGVEILYGIHPVAGRMPGHMNVLLAEADVPYDELADLTEVNGEFEHADVALVIGANDVVNPSARNEKSSPLYGMPILNADFAKTVIVMKRGRGRGFAGVENPLFTLEHSGVVFGDAKKSLVSVISEVKQL